MPVTTSRFTAALATIISAVAAWVIARYLAADQETAALITLVATTVSGLLIPAAAARVGTVDAAITRRAVSPPKRMY